MKPIIIHRDQYGSVGSVQPIPKYLFQNINADTWKQSLLLKRSHQIKKYPKKWKKSKRGGSAPDIKKSTIQNVDFLRRGGGHIFIPFPNVNAHLKGTVQKKNLLA